MIYRVLVHCLCAGDTIDLFLRQGKIDKENIVVVPAMDGVLEIIAPDGEKAMAKLKAGVSYFRQKGVHHNVVNANDFEFSLVEVEFK